MPNALHTPRDLTNKRLLHTGALALECLQSPNFWPYNLDKSLSRFLIPSLASSCYHNLAQSPDIDTPLNWYRVPACPDCSLSLTWSWTTIHPASAGSTDLRNLYPMRILSPEQHLPILDGSQTSPSFESEQQQGLSLIDWMTSYQKAGHDCLTIP